MIEFKTAHEQAIWAAVYAGELTKSRSASERYPVDAAVRAADWAVADLRRLVAEDAEREAAKTPPAMPAKGKR